MFKLNFEKNELNLRITSAIFLGVLAIVSLFSGTLFGLLCVMVAGIGFQEWYTIVNKGKKVDLLTVLSLVVVLFPMLLSSHLAIDVGILSLVLMGATFFLFLMWFYSMRHSFVLAFGIPYIGIPMNALVWLHSDPNLGIFLILYVFFITWGNDTAAYFIGKKYGKTKLAPSISPNKTWEGLGGSALGALIGGLIVTGLVWLFEPTDPNVEIAVNSIFDLPLILIMLISAVLGMLGQVGDLIESFVKRHYGVKDSGDLIPGHGGILDRVDALLVVSVAAAAIHYIIQGIYRMSVTGL